LVGKAPHLVGKKRQKPSDVIKLYQWHQKLI
jgi:hypothetical protein